MLKNGNDSVLGRNFFKIRDRALIARQLSGNAPSYVPGSTLLIEESLVFTGSPLITSNCCWRNESANLLQGRSPIG
jgi:hypothetical protein